MEAKPKCEMCDDLGYVVEIESDMQCCYEPTKYGSCCGNAIRVPIQVQYLCPKCQ